MVLFVSKLDSISGLSGLTLLECLKEACDKYVFIDLDADEMVLAFSDERESQVRTLLTEFPSLHVGTTDPRLD